MANAILKGCAKEVRNYAKSIGSPLTQAQTYEIIARARGFQNANVLAAQYPETVEKPQHLEKKSAAIISSDITVETTRLETWELLKLHRMDLGDGGLPREYLARRLVIDEVQQTHLTIDVVMPFPVNQTLTYKAISEILFRHSDAVTSAKVETVDYPYGKHNRAYRVSCRPYYYTLPNGEDTSARVGNGHSLDGVRASLLDKGDITMGYGFGELDWKTGRARNYRMLSGDVEKHPPTDAEFLELYDHRTCRGTWLSKDEFDTLKNLAGSYYEVTQGTYEGLRLAFYV